MHQPRSGMKAAAVCCLVLVAFATTLCASPDKKSDKPIGKLLYGKVLDSEDNPVPDAVVYVTNTRTRAIRSYIVGKDGGYRFPALTAAVDYEVYAQSKGRKSDTKSVSQFDDRSQVYMVLKINTR